LKALPNGAASNGQRLCWSVVGAKVLAMLPNGNLLVPMRAESDGVIGDGLVEITPEHPDYQHWLEYLERVAQVLESE
jgi:hypothetical protein